MELARIHNKIHTRNCRHVVGDRSWIWAVSRSKEYVVAAARRNGLTECGTCKPFGGELR